MRKTFFFFIGTEAELIKIFPVILECMNRDAICNIISSGQNDLKKSRIMSQTKLNGNFIELSNESSITKSAVGLLSWFIKTKHIAKKQIENSFGTNALKGQVIIVHGDTVSTLMGAWIGRRMGATVCHVEAGLRSYHLFNPFPEEIDRILTSRVSRIHFAPGVIPTQNLVKAKGIVVDTEYNTILDSLYYSKHMPVKTKEIGEIIQTDYFVFVMHRQENLARREFVKQVIDRVKQFSEKRKCVLILHKITENTLQEMGILERLKNNSNFILLPRVDYFDFMKLLENSQYVITDGGSNQEELFYMGKPCLIMREATERQEGIGDNAVLCNKNVDEMLEFEKNYLSYRKKSIIGEISPSRIIADKLMEMKG